ncbi:hypothetical protein EAG_04408 [Camponotus floridanus]|uniref:Nucleolus and neural progenitor protein-like N-terminal domain-containing protein n=1 Tax=Camponotus floridanus TaxID=104421 RepID=E2A0G7_CAMFO|nr:hypothetical protein EAG_04408 [Camponotus floridanus]
MTQIGNTARYAAHFLKARISLGHAWSIALLAYANVSRIWFCSRHILRRSCSWYDELYSCSKNFEYVGTHWIPRNQSLPCDLRAWLSSESQMNMSDTTEEKIFEKSFVEEAFDTNEISFDTSNEITIDFPKLSQENASTDNILSDDSSSDNDDIDDIGGRVQVNRVSSWSHPKFQTEEIRMSLPHVVEATGAKLSSAANIGAFSPTLIA